MALPFTVACCALALAGVPSVAAAAVKYATHSSGAFLATKASADDAGVQKQAFVEAIPRHAYATVPDLLNESFIQDLVSNIVNTAGISKDHIHVYNDEQMAKSACRISKRLAKEGVPGAFEAFGALRPGAFKADLWRYMALWDHGGVYLDMDLRFAKPVDHWVNFSEPKLVLVQDRPPNSYWNALMASPPNHPGLKAVIASVIDHVQHLQYGDSPLAVTGPIAFFRSLASVPDIKNSMRCDLKMKVTSSECGGGTMPVCHAFVVEKQDVGDIIAFKSVAAATTVHGLLHYATLYQNHDIFCSELGPPCKQLPSCD